MVKAVGHKEVDAEASKALVDNELKSLSNVLPMLVTML